MWQPNLRTFTAMGLTVGKPLKNAGLRLYQVVNQHGATQLVVRGSIFGPSWASIKHQLETFEIEHTFVRAGGFWILCSDGELVRKLLDEIVPKSRRSTREDVFIPDRGFIPSGMPRKLEFRMLVAPVLILVFTLAFGVAVQLWPSAPASEPEATASPSCALDLPDIEFQEWFRQNLLNSRPKDSDLIVVQTDLGKLNLEVDQALGSTVRVSGSLECGDGRSKEFQFRTDDSADGALVEIGTKLDP